MSALKVQRSLSAGAALAALSSSPAAHAQFPDLFQASAQYLPGVPVQQPRPTEAQIASYEGALNVPLVLGAHTFLIPGAAYHVDAVSYSKAPAAFIELRAFHSLEVPVLFVQVLPQDWSVSLRLAPGLAADSLDTDLGSLHLSAVALATHSCSERLLLGAGALASYSFGTLLPLPALYVEWTPIDHVRIESFVPAFFDARYTFWDRLELGVRADVAGNSYAVRDERIRKAWPCVPGPADDPATPSDEARADRAECFDHVAYSVGTAELVVGARLFGSVWWTAMLGHSFFRRLEQRNADDRRVSAGLQSLPDTAFVRTSLNWRIPED